MVSTCPLLRDGEEQYKYIQATGRTALAKLHTGACAMLLPSCTFDPNIWKYSDRIFISVGRSAAPEEYGRVGAGMARETAHSADTTNTLQNILKCESSKAYYGWILKSCQEGKQQDPSTEKRPRRGRIRPL